MSVYSDTRVLQLLRQADEAKALLEQVRDGNDAETTRAVRETLYTIYVDLGRRVHELSDQVGGPDELELTPTSAPSREQAPPARSAPRRAPLPGQAPGTLVADGSLPLAPVAGMVSDELEVLSTDSIDILSSGGLRAATFDDAQVAMDWLPRARGLLGRFAMARNLDDPTEQAVELSRLQMATTRIDSQWAGLPLPVRMALLGAFAARVRALQARLPPGERSLKQALLTLADYRAQHDLPLPPALVPASPPEHGTWTRDAAAWWSLLHDNLTLRT